MTIHQVLTKYWGYASFRPLQEEIIQSAMEGKDTLALLPTGGGKSICYQVPGIAMNGICIVISPLIALMKDQVENLKKRGIGAAAIYSGMHLKEIDLILNNAVNGSIKFLYVSPERLVTDKMRNYVKEMNVNILAVDEAHCISQWGYDFRPPYLKISEIRPFIKNAPVLALTATATEKVVIDIQNKLSFKAKNVFRKSFERKNLVYAVLKEENKLNRLLSIVRKIKGTGVVYVRNRKKTKEIAYFLNKNGHSSEFYHAGLDMAEREKKQQQWMQGKVRVMVSTNAFGMGIDKPDVRFVVHMDIPDTIEAYFQEAGRGGRDEKKAYSVLLYDDADIAEANSFHEFAFPEMKEIRKVYNFLCNFLQVPIGSGKNQNYNFNFYHFSDKYNLDHILAFKSLEFIEKEGYISFSETIKRESKIHIIIDRNELYRFQVSEPRYDAFIKTLLRLYGGGLFTDFTKIYEQSIAKAFKISENQVIEALKKLQKLGILDYVEKSNHPQITLLTERIKEKDIIIADEIYADRKKTAREKLDAMFHYLKSRNNCRSQLLLAYFGEKNSKRCGMCDVCLKRNSLDLSRYEFDFVLEKLKPLLKEKTLMISEIVSLLPKIPEEKIVKIMQWLFDNEKIDKKEGERYHWK